MKILYTSTDVRQAVAEIFSSSKGRRVAITAFVGKDADAYLPRPKGIELYCWPKAGSTNPYTVKDLQHLGIEVNFVDSLHMKVYWTEDQGAVITSANLSTSALGAGCLLEVGIFVSSSEIDIDRILGSFEHHPASNARISRLEIQHKDYWKRNPSLASEKSKLKSFSQWYEDRWPLWKLCDVTFKNIRLFPESKELLKNEHGSEKYNEVMNVLEKDRYHKNDWILCFNVEKRSGLPIEWMFAHHLVKRSTSGNELFNPDNLCQIIQVFPLRVYDQPPFHVDEPFKKAFLEATSELGGISKIIGTSSKKPSRKLLALIYKHLN